MIIDVMFSKEFSRVQGKNRLQLEKSFMSEIARKQIYSYVK